MTKKYHKATDVEGRIFTLIEVDGKSVRVAERNSAQNRVSFRSISSFNVTDYAAPVTEISAEEYNAVLKEWGYNEPAEVGSPEGEPCTSTVADASVEAAPQPDAASTESGSGEGNAAPATPEAQPAAPDEAKAEEEATGEGMPEKATDAAA